MTTDEAGTRITEPIKCLVIQPFGKKPHPRTGVEVDNDQVYAAVRRLEKFDTLPFKVKVWRADEGNISVDDVHEEVLLRLSSSDFCVADLTGQNPNVLYEAGVAKGLGLAIVFLCQHRSDVPADLHKYIAVEYSMATLDQLPGAIASHFDVVQKGVQTRREALVRNVKYYATRNDADIRRRILEANDSIDILQTNLITISTEYLQQLIQALTKRPNLRLRLLTLDPQSIFVNFRGAQVGFVKDIALYRAELDSSLRSVLHSLRAFGDRVEIRTYDDFPAQLVFYFDREILVCVVSATGRSRNNCAFLIDGRIPGADQSFTKHFETMWSDEQSRRYPPPV
jgi:hypothetical protein